MPTGKPLRSHSLQREGQPASGKPGGTTGGGHPNPKRHLPRPRPSNSRDTWRSGLSTEEGRFLRQKAFLSLPGRGIREDRLRGPAVPLLDWGPTTQARSQGSECFLQRPRLEWKHLPFSRVSEPQLGPAGYQSVSTTPRLVAAIWRSPCRTHPPEGTALELHIAPGSQRGSIKAGPTRGLGQAVAPHPPPPRPAPAPSRRAREQALHSATRLAGRAAGLRVTWFLSPSPTPWGPLLKPVGGGGQGRTPRGTDRESLPCHTDAGLLWPLHAAAATDKTRRSEQCRVQAPLKPSTKRQRARFSGKLPRSLGRNWQTGAGGICFRLLLPSRDREGKQPSLASAPRPRPSRAGKAGPWHLWVTLGHPVGSVHSMQAQEQAAREGRSVARGWGVPGGEWEPPSKQQMS